MSLLEWAHAYQGPLWTLFAIGFALMAFVGLPLGLFTLYIAVVFWLMQVPPTLMIIAGIILFVLNVPIIRTYVLSSPLVSLLKKLNILPEISETEQVALEAGTTWVDKELFSGKPDFHEIHKNPYARLSPEEQAFMDNQVEALCGMMTDWEIFQEIDLRPEVWNFIKREKFFGLVIAKEHGGLGFSALANSEVVAKIASRSMPLAVTVMVPNSLGPGELITHYGTPEQKEYYLPRLADGREIPCFALTEPDAGSDAGSMRSTGEVFKGEDGQLYIRLNWNKRYITLAAVSTLLGLAIKLHDPGNLLGKGKDLGITCVLVPTKTKGIAVGRRHNPMGVPFFNSPTQGTDVVIPIDQIIGGAKGAGQGWQMLMECLAVGRSISLPAQATGGSKLLARIVGAYAATRKQFNVEISKFEGVEEPLSRIAGLTYLLEASRIFTVGAVDSGKKPAVVSAIAKYQSTEIGRLLVNDGMDILGGAGISRGPRNLIANNYIATPIGITVEGANILTRSMIIFGQGAIRCHPFAYTEVKALEHNDLKAFDGAFWGHVGFVIRNTFRALLLTLTRGYLAGVPGGPMRKYYRRLAWASASFSFMADLALLSYGGALKLKEHITGRYADILSWMYLATAVLQRFEKEGRKAEHKAFAEWALQYSMVRIQTAFEGIYQNIETPLVAFLFKGPIALWARFNSFGSLPADKLSHEIANALTIPGEVRDAITAGIYHPEGEHESLPRFEHAIVLMFKAAQINEKIHGAVKAHKLPKARPEKLWDKALAQGIITDEDLGVLKRADAAREDLIQVDSFALDEFKTTLMMPEKKPAVTPSYSPEFHVH